MMVKNFLLILLTNFSSPRVLECHVKNYIPINHKKINFTEKNECYICDALCDLVPNA